MMLKRRVVVAGLGAALPAVAAAQPRHIVLFHERRPPADEADNDLLARLCAGDGRHGGAEAGDEYATQHRQYICWPPLIDSVEPVMKPASSAIRNTTPRAISSALPSRPTGILATIFSSTAAGTAETMSVSV